MVITELKQLYLNSKLKTNYSINEINAIVKRAVEYLANDSYLNIITHKEIIFDATAVNEILERLLNAEPIQYVLGHEWFMQKKYFVNKDVLIPRPETEELVKWILEDITNIEINILDIGTGSGIIPISIKSKIPTSQVFAMDKFANALNVAKFNAETHKTNIYFIEDDILNPTYPFENEFDIIVSNPPYISDAEKNNMDKNVLNHEPHSALFVTNQDPLQFYKAIIHFAKNKAKNKASIYVELNTNFAFETEELFQQHGYQTILRKDMYGNNRMLKAIL